jgi:hypothetical protein
MDHHALFRACVISAKVRSNNALLFMKPLRLMLTPELYHAANGYGGLCVAVFFN